MKKTRVLLLLMVFVFVGMSLVACGSTSQSAKPSGTPSTTNDGQNILEEAKGWFAGVAYSAAGVPIIGPLVTGILGKMEPKDHWIVGAVIIFLILSALGGGASSSGRS
jgi:hypothetical protein